MVNIVHKEWVTSHINVIIKYIFISLFDKVTVNIMRVNLTVYIKF